MTQIVIVNVDVPDLSPEQITEGVVALNDQIDDLLSPPAPFGWGINAKIRVGLDANDVRSDEWVLGLFAHPDQANALGDHDLAPNGQPLMRVFPLLDAKFGESWVTTASHEVLEALVDPLLALAFQAPNGTFWAGEICDAVEADTYIHISGLKLSNFVLPLYFQPPANIAELLQRGYTLDALGVVKEPFEIRPGGYGQRWTEHGWQFVTETVTEHRSAQLRHTHNRVLRRRLKHRRGADPILVETVQDLMLAGCNCEPTKRTETKAQIWARGSLHLTTCPEYDGPR